MHKSPHIDKLISYVMNYVISKHSPSLESCNPAVLQYATFLYNSGRIVDI